VTAGNLSLDALALRHGVDKSSRVHGYTRAYERHLAPLRQRPIKLLEIGIGDGASLRMWRDYFPQARIYGLDVVDCKRLDGGSIRTFQGGQADEDVLERLLHATGALDVVIDDGSHRWADQIASFQKVYPHLTPGGVYAIEDLHTSYWDRYESGEQSTVDFLCDLVDELNLHGRSGYGSLKNDPAQAAVWQEMNVYQRTVESITFYKSLVFVQKQDA
jgi:hypothetical protein